MVCVCLFVCGEEGGCPSGPLPAVGGAEEGKIVLVDVLGNVKAVSLDELLVVRQFFLRTGRHN